MVTVSPVHPEWQSHMQVDFESTPLPAPHILQEKTGRLPPDCADHGSVDLRVISCIP